MISNDPMRDGWAARDIGEKIKLRALVASPIPVQGQVAGCITALRVGNEPPFEQADLALLTLFADHVALALEHARLYEKLRGQADTDSLTGLYNHRAIIEHLDREIARMKRTTPDLSVLMMDIDNFKAINDTFGHLTGDAVLQELSQRLLASVRIDDLVGRYGGEEFLAVLPGTDAAGAIEAARRIHEQVSAASYRPPLSQGKIQISIGVAAFPSDAFDRQSLIAAADQALYEAKRQGGGSTTRAAKNKLSA